MKWHQRASSTAPSSSSSRAPSGGVGDHYLRSSAMMEHEEASPAINAPRKASATPTLESPDQLSGGKGGGSYDDDDELFPVRVRFKRITTLFMTLVFVVIVGVIMLLCSGEGILIDEFDSEDKDNDARKKLLDKYNAYSSSIVTLFTKPLEIYLGMVLAVTFLCFASRFGTSAKFSGHYSYTLTIVTAGAAYLLLNGFNALNVQLAPQPVASVITPFDLSFTSFETADSYDTPLAEYSGPTRVPFMYVSDVAYLEESERNDLVNTILHNAVAPIKLNANPQCKTNPVPITSDSRRTGAVISYGFPSRAWHPQALTIAVPVTRSLTIAVADNSTQSAKVVNVSSAADDTTGSAASETMTTAPVLPMNASIAVQLLVQGIAMTQLLLPWWETSYLDDLTTTKIKSSYTPTVVTTDTDTTSDAKTALMSELLFTPSAMSSSTELLTQSKQLLFNLFNKAANVSAAEVNATFSRHNKIVTGVIFDSLTLEIPLRRSHFSRELYYNAADQHYAYRSNASTSQDGNYYYDLDLDTDCSRDACVTTQPEYAFSGDETFIEPQVHALAACVNVNGSDDPMLRFQYHNVTSDVSPLKVTSRVSCPSNSKRVMFTVSLGHRVQGDAMDTRELKDRATDNPRVLRLTNARKVYSITVTRISWEAQNLRERYNALCRKSEEQEASDHAANPCMGLWYALELDQSRTKLVKSQHLLVSSIRLPLAVLSSYQPEFNKMSDIIDSTRLTPLVTKIVRQSSGVSTSGGQESGSDLVYPRRFTEANWPAEANENTTNCSARSEDVIEHTESNHLYMEQTLQPAITAGFFFLFQDAVAQDVVTPLIPKDTSSNISLDSNVQVDYINGVDYFNEVYVLDFIDNTQSIQVYLSSPLPNVIATLTGAGLLLLASLAVGVFGGRKKERKLQSLMTANSIAELQINDSKYPPWLLERTIKPTSVLFADAEEALVANQQEKRFGFKTRSKASDLNKFRIQRLVLEHEDGGGQQVEFPSADGFGDPNNGSVFA